MAMSAEVLRARSNRDLWRNGLLVLAAFFVLGALWGFHERRDALLCRAWQTRIEHVVPSGSSFAGKHPPRLLVEQLRQLEATRPAGCETPY